MNSLRVAVLVGLLGFVGILGCHKKSIEGEVAATATAPPPPEVGSPELGKKIVAMRGCIACHSDDGTRRIGPSFKGLFGSQVQLSDGTTVKADEAYLRESIENPAAKTVKTFTLVMPPFKEQIREPEMQSILAYIKSI